MQRTRAIQQQQRYNNSSERYNYSSGNNSNNTAESHMPLLCFTTDNVASKARRRPHKRGAMHGLKNGALKLARASERHSEAYQHNAHACTAQVNHSAPHGRYTPPRCQVDTHHTGATRHPASRWHCQVALPGGYTPHGHNTPPCCGTARWVHTARLASRSAVPVWPTHTCVRNTPSTASVPGECTTIRQWKPRRTAARRPQS